MARVLEESDLKAEARARPVWSLSSAQIALAAGALVLGLALLARILGFPLRHDEELYLPAGIQFSTDGLYPELGYNHLPNLPILLNAVFAITGTAHALLVGRLLVFIAWIAAAAALASAGSSVRS